jgi:hypothetical protein
MTRAGRATPVRNDRKPRKSGVAPIAHSFETPVSRQYGHFEEAGSGIGPIALAVRADDFLQTVSFVSG